MSQQCKMTQTPVVGLDPFFVEFYAKGALRRIRPDEKKAAEGMCFLCPRCKSDKEKRHYLIFLFENAPEEARPHGRFHPEVNQYNQLLKPHEQSLHEIRAPGIMRTLLRPQDVCGWEGYLIDGKVLWRKSLIERAG